MPTFNQSLIKINPKHPGQTNHLQESQIVLSALSNIETAIINHSPEDVVINDKIVSAELTKIHLMTKDSIILDMIFSIKYNWQIYSGKKVSESFRPNTALLKQWLIDDCKELKNYIQKYL